MVLFRSTRSEVYGNLFAEFCKEAAVPGRTHGLRKAGAKRLAENGGTEYEVMTFLGHKTPNEARKYVKQANRKKMADAAMAKMK